MVIQGSLGSKNPASGNVLPLSSPNVDPPKSQRRRSRLASTRKLSGRKSERITPFSWDVADGLSSLPAPSQTQLMVDAALWACTSGSGCHCSRGCHPCKRAKRQYQTYRGIISRESAKWKLRENAMCLLGASNKSAPR